MVGSIRGKTIFINFCLVFAFQIIDFQLLGSTHDEGEEVKEEVKEEIKEEIKKEVKEVIEEVEAKEE